MRLFALLACVTFFAGCTEEVRTYDSHGNLLGRCQVDRSFFVGGTAATCAGSANPQDQGVKAVPAPPIAAGEDTKCPDGQVYVLPYKTCVPSSWVSKNAGDH